MKYETLKSVVLALLVLTSGVLTWSIWTYQPKEENYFEQMHKVTVSEQNETPDLIKPLRVLYNTENANYGTVLDSAIQKIVHTMGQWHFQNIKSVRMLNEKQIRDIISSESQLVITYPDTVPFDLYRGVVQVETEYPDASFDSIIIDLANTNEKTTTISFIDRDEGRLYESYVEAEKVDELKNELTIDQFEIYEIYTMSTGQQFFLPAEETELLTIQYLPDVIEPAKFKNALFSDPSLVRGDSFASGEQYTDGKSMMKANKSTQTLLYINPRQEPDGQWDYEGDEHIIHRSITFVNEHSGWTDDYRYFSLGEYQHRTTFRLFYEGRPVFNNSDMAEIRQYWGPEEIYQYQRPYFKLDVELPNPKKQVLPSGQDAMKQLFSYYELELDETQVQDFLIGYSLNWDKENPDVLVLEPSWYYLYAGSWLKVPMNEKEAS